MRLLIDLVIASAFAMSALSVWADMRYAPIEYRTVSGIRPFVRVSMNGKPFLLMVHSGTDFFMMTTPANAAVMESRPPASSTRWAAWKQRCSHFRSDHAR